MFEVRRWRGNFEHHTFFKKMFDFRSALLKLCHQKITKGLKYNLIHRALKKYKSKTQSLFFILRHWLKNYVFQNGLWPPLLWFKKINTCKPQSKKSKKRNNIFLNTKQIPVLLRKTIRPLLINTEKLNKYFKLIESWQPASCWISI